MDGAKSGVHCRQCELQVKSRHMGETVAGSGNNNMELNPTKESGFESLQEVKCPYMILRKVRLTIVGEMHQTGRARRSQGSWMVVGFKQGIGGNCNIVRMEVVM